MPAEEVIDSAIENDTSVAVASDTAPDSQAPAADSPAVSDTASQATPGTPATDEPGDSQAPAGAKPALQTDPHKEFNDFKAQSGRELAEARRQLEHFQRQTMTFQQEKAKQAQEAERQSLKRWNSQHPEHAKFGQTMAKRQALNQQLQALRSQPDMDEGRFQSVARAMTDASLSQEEQSELLEHHQMSQDFLMNPMARAEEIAERVAVSHFNRMIQQFQQHGQAQNAVQADLSNLPPAALPAMKEALEAGASYDMAIKYAKQEARLAELEGSRQQVQQRSSQTAEQLRLQKSNAQTTRDPKPAPITTQALYELAVTEAKRQGVGTADPKFHSIYNKIEAKHRAL